MVGIQPYLLHDSTTQYVPHSVHYCVLYSPALAFLFVDYLDEIVIREILIENAEAMMGLALFQCLESWIRGVNPFTPLERVL